MPEEIAKLNIEHFKKPLETETDPTRRAVIEKLLAEQERKLAALKTRSKNRAASHLSSTQRPSGELCGNAPGGAGRDEPMWVEG